MIGDVVGDPGLEVLEKRLPVLRAEYRPLLVTVNGENAAGGFGLTEESLNRIFAAGADVVTSGNHVWEKREFWPVLESGKAVLRPANYPDRLPGGFSFPANPPESGPAADDSPESGPVSVSGNGPSANSPSEPAALLTVPGRGWLALEKPVSESPAGTIPAGDGSTGKRIPFLVINLQGRKRMTAIDCPFRCFDRILAESAGRDKEAAAENPRVVIVDFHAESTDEKEALGYYLDGRVSVVAGTHTHVQTADERILPGGTAYITDLGMTGAMNGVIGMDAGICINRAKSQIAYRMECARPDSEQDCAVQGVVAEIDGETGRALGIRRINV
ncbi:MAG: YmdB family metallophosphoesterase [Treponema sp.]|jgi:calcineurin-like phosphoesterase|nr:YmdB family metallophosphoesterase [Treponema sp.]